MLRLGTSGWTAPGWHGAFYQSGTKQIDYIAHYACRFSTVEIDTTFYANPTESTIAGWRDKTPDGFVFAAKAPQVITHKKFMDDCEHETNAFLKAVSGLGPKLGPILFQFPYYTKRDEVTEDQFLVRLSRYLKTLPQAGFRFAVECRNKQWMNAALYSILHEHRVACCLIDHPWMTRPDHLFRDKEVISAPFTYIRWIGDRKKIEKLTKVWDNTILDREVELRQWVPHVRALLDRGVEVFGYMSNHYTGHAPADVDRLAAILDE